MLHHHSHLLPGIVQSCDSQPTCTIRITGNFKKTNVVELRISGFRDHSAFKSPPSDANGLRTTGPNPTVLSITAFLT